MSIRWVAFTVMGIAPAALFPGALSAQSSGDEVVGPMLDRAREAYGPDEPQPERPADCDIPVDDSEIIVCAPVEEDPDRYRVTSRLDRADDSHLSWDGRAPDLEPQYPGVVVARGCFVPPCPPPPAYMIDFSELPEAPPGSDADRIGRGLAPRGNRFDDGETAAQIEVDDSPAQAESDPPEG